MDEFPVVPALAEATFLLGPPLAFGVAIWMRRQTFRRLYVKSTCVATIIATAALGWLGFGFSARWMNTVWYLFCYVLYCVVAASSWRIRRMWLRVLAVPIVLLPIGLGYLAATVGALGLGIVVSEFAGAPFEVERMGNGFVCEKTWWGWAAGESGYMVRIERAWPWFPFIVKEIASTSVDQTQGDVDRSCADVLARHK